MILDYEECAKDTPTHRYTQRNCEARIDVARKHAEKLKLTSAECSEQIAMYNETQHKLAKLSLDSPAFSKVDLSDDLRSSISAVNELFTRLHTLRFTLMEEVRSQIFQPNDEFVSVSTRTAKEHKDNLKTTMTELEAVVEKHSSFTKLQVEKNQKGYSDIAARMWQLKETSMEESLEYLTDLNRLTRRQQVLAFESLSNYISCQMRYFKGGLSLLESAKADLDNIFQTTAALHEKEEAEIQLSAKECQRVKQQLLARLKRQRTHAASAPVSAPLPKYETTDTVICGELYKREINKDKKEEWHRRYLSLEGGLLVYRTRPRLNLSSKDVRDQLQRKASNVIIPRKSVPAVGEESGGGGIEEQSSSDPPSSPPPQAPNSSDVMSTSPPGFFMDSKEFSTPNKRHSTFLRENSGTSLPPLGKSTPLRSLPRSDSVSEGSASSLGTLDLYDGGALTVIGGGVGFGIFNALNSHFAVTGANASLANSSSLSSPSTALSSSHANSINTSSPASSAVSPSAAAGPASPAVVANPASAGTSAQAASAPPSTPLLSGGGGHSQIEIDSPVLISNMSLCSVRPFQHKERMHVFEVITPSEKTLLQADSDEEVAEWIAVLQNAIAASLEVEETSTTQRNAIATRALTQQIRAVPGNNHCIDCGKADPDWASINFGVLFCIECSGVHRRIGVHITKVRSLSLDKWSPGLLRMMAAVGNTLGNEIFEAGFAASGLTHPVPETPSAQREEFLRLKYEAKKFVARDPSLATQQQLDNALYEASAADDMRAALNCILLGANVNYSINGKSCLHVAAAANHTAVAHLLVQNLADVHAVDANGKSPLSLMKSLQEYAPELSKSTAKIIGPARPSVGITFAGYLKKQGEKRKAWQKRYLVLRDSILYFFKSDKDVKESSKADWSKLAGRKVIVPSYEVSLASEELGVPLSFKLSHAGMRTYYLQAFSQLDLDAWIQALKLASTADTYVAAEGTGEKGTLDADNDSDED